MEENSITLAYLLRTPISDITYDQLLSFLGNGEPEGIHLDYKQEINASSLKKHFAAFSNKYGGIIIIGVQEDKKTGVPINIDGIEIDAKKIEQLNQIASNVDPLPNYEIKKIDNNGKGFILVKISEGGEPPYFVLNDSSVYVRTGNITKDYIESASSEELRILFSKKETSRKAREINELFVKQVFESHLARGEKERLKDKEAGKETIDFNLGKHCTFVEVLIQPSNPIKELYSPYDLKDLVINNTINIGRGSWYPPTFMSYEPVPKGVSAFSWNNRTGAVSNFQLYSNGVIYYQNDILRTMQNGTELVYLESICSHLLINTRFASHFYNIVGYSGPIIGMVRLQNISGMAIQRISYNNIFHDGSKRALLNNYELKFNTDTVQLNDSESNKKFEIDKIKELHWHFGFESKNWDQTYEKFVNEGL